MKELTQEYVKSLFNYKNGFLYWKVKRQKIKVGDKAGYLHTSGYYFVGINCKIYKIHRIIYLYHNNYLPKFLDHIDRDKGNNKIENLRPATKSQNNMNRESYKNSSSKYKGVHWYKLKNKWMVRIRYQNKSIFLGYFDNEIEAAKIYNKAAIKYHGEFANLNEVE